MIYCLDTSAINQLNDDFECDVITTGLIANNTILITALNVAEALATKDAGRRESLVALEKRLARGANPIVLPSELLQMQCLAHARGSPRQSLPISTSDPLILIAYRHLSSLDEQTRQLILTWKKDLYEFDDLFTVSRPHFQTLFSKGTVERPPSLSRLIRDHYGKDDDFLYEYVSSMYQGACGVELDRDGFRQIFRDIPELLLYLFSYAHATYHRAIQEQGYSRHRNAGPVDLWSSLYLPHCDYFVTHDKQQRRALRVMNLFQPRSTRIFSYESFRARLLQAVKSAVTN